MIENYTIKYALAMQSDRRMLCIATVTFCIIHTVGLLQSSLHFYSLGLINDIILQLNAVSTHKMYINPEMNA